MVIRVLLFTALLPGLFPAVTRGPQSHSLERVASVVALIGMYMALFPKNAYAYLDAGTGSMLLQALIAAIAGIVVVIRAYWSKWKNLFTPCKQVTQKSPAEVTATERHSK